jgi:NAD-dependent deacetylase
LKNNINLLVELFKSSKNIVVLTGAGISTESGIPDFRSPKKGLWSQFSEKIVEIGHFKKNPEMFYKFLKTNLKNTFDATPNFSHYFLSKYESMGYIKAIITQNIDNLHQKAGSKKVLELHGNLINAACLNCNEKYNTNSLIKSFEETNLTPKCHCGGLIKPDVIFFGEMLPHDILTQSYFYASQSELFIILGSSLLVTPTALLPYRAKEGGAKIVIINFQETPFDIYADIVINDKISKVLEEVGGKLQK